MYCNNEVPWYARLGGYLLGIVVVILVGSFIVGIRTVNPGTTAISVRFGAVQGVRGEGFYIDPLTNYEIFDTKVINLQFDYAAATKDLQDMNITAALNYRLVPESLESFYREYGTQEEFQSRILVPAISQTLKSTTTTYNAESLLVERAAVRGEILAQLKDQFADYPIQIEGLNLVNVGFTSQEFNQAIERKQVAEQRALQAKFELEQAKAEAQKQEVLDRTLTDKLLQKQFIEKWNGQLPQYMGSELDFILSISK